MFIRGGFPFYELFCLHIALKFPKIKNKALPTSFFQKFHGGVKNTQNFMLVSNRLISFEKLPKKQGWGKRSFSTFITVIKEFGCYIILVKLNFLKICLRV